MLTNGVLFRSLFENLINGCAHCSCIYNADGTLEDYYHVLVNKAFGEITGLDALGKYISELMPDLHTTNPELFEIYGRVSKGGMPETFESYVPQGDIWFNISVYCVEVGTFTVVFSNINAQKNEQKILADARKQIESAYEETLNGLVWALRMRDLSTEEHSKRVIELSGRLARKVGVPEDEVKNIERGALLHDIGKLLVRDDVLLKPGKLNEEETELMRQHVTLAYKLLKPIEFISQTVIDIPHYHHERWDGKGYPDKLKGLDIPLGARIFSPVDVFDALTSERPYRAAFSEDFTLQYIENVAGELFDPTVAKAFVKMMRE